MKKDNYFKRLGYVKEDIPTKKFSNFEISELPAQAIYTGIDKFIEGNKGVFDYDTNQRQKNCGLGKAYTEEVQEKCNSGFYLKINQNNVADEPVNISASFKLDEKNDVLYDQSFIEIAENTKAKLSVFLESDECSLKHNFFRSGLMRIKVKSNSELNLIKVQNLNKESRNFETLKIDADKNAVINIYDIQLGAKVNGASTSTYIHEDDVEVNIFPLYFVNEQRRADFEQNFIINGKKTNAVISATGVLKDKSKKMFRGNLFFNRGCSGSFARFSDNTNMFDKGVVGMTIPTIFCDEDDVIGEHAASFSAIDDDQLYYLMTRGFDELSAKILMAKAAFLPILNIIDDKAMRDKLIDELNINLNETIEAKI
ncbi:MAG: Fe-S cluster assembly protein SufD [Treponema sp.]|nr:MAG: Fe-S cluster assembly protein SufD [Treponema sp.]